MTHQNLTISEAQKKVDEWIKTVGVKYFSELTNLGILMEEVGELSRIMVREFGDQSFKQNETNLNKADELADIFWVLLCLSNQMNIDLEDALLRNIEKKTSRDQTRHKENPKLK